jgi:hypothetical protein
VDTVELAGGPGGMDPLDEADPIGEASGIAGYARWLCPVYPADLVDGWISSTAAEARLLGAVAGGAVSALGRALVEDGEVAGTAQGLLTVARRTALLGADLTAVVTGPPSAELARVLDRLTDRESRGTASIWRFSPATVRRSFDEGFTEARILADLAAIAAGGLPQPLEYLVKDVARRHGELGVTGVVCVIRGSDESLLVELLELVAHRKLAKLGLHMLAPTVLASELPPEQTLALLREAGYAPVPAGLDGVSTIRRADRSRAGRTGREDSAKDAGPKPAKSAPPQPAETAAVAADPRALAERLRATPVPARMSEAETREVIARYTGHQRNVLGELPNLTTYGVPVRVQERLDDGTKTWWALRSVEIEEGALIGWCPELQDYWRVRLDSIVLVRQYWG